MDFLKSYFSEKVQAEDVEQKHEVSITCEEPYIFIRGTNISISDASEALIRKLETKDPCASLLTPGKFSILNVFALDTVFIDQDIPFHSAAVAVIAPRWKVTDKVMIDLNGTAGKSECGNTRCRARDGSGLTIKGTDGEPGQPGVLGGSFFGIGVDFENGSNLTVTANGGQGGIGQDGGHGKGGTDGKDAFVPKSVRLMVWRGERSDNIPPRYSGKNSINGFRCEEISGEWGKWYLSYITVNRIFGEAGSVGGDGGDGGKGGKGGSAGTINFFQLGNSSNISLSNTKGSDGESGQGGTGGRGGRNGNDVIARCEFYDKDADTRDESLNYDWSLVETKQKGSALSGKNGVRGRKERKEKDTETEVTMKPAFVLNTYKRYLRESLRNRNEAAFLKQFLHRLDTNEDIKKIYDTLALFDELQGIEEQFHDLNNDVDFLPFYQSLLSRISDYAFSPKPGENSIEHKKVLNYLYTATLGRIYNLKDNSESDLIMHVTPYLDDVRVDLESLKETQKKRNKMDIINKYKNAYKSRIDEKTKEAESLVKELIKPEIDNIGKKIDKNVELLMNEIIELEKQAKVEQQKLTDKKRELENGMGLGILFSVFKFAGYAISILGPVGAAAGLAIGTSTSIAESLILDSKTVPGQTVELPKGITSDLQSLEQQIKAARDKKIARLNALLEEISEESNQFPEYLNDMKGKVTQIRENLNKLDENNPEFPQIQTLEEALKQDLERKRIELNNQKTSEDKKAKRAKAVVEKFEQAVKLGAVVFEAYNQYKNDQHRLDLLTEQIEQSENKFKMLKEYEAKIYTVITPILQNMKDDLNETARQLHAKSRVSLDVTKWQIQSALRDMKSQMLTLTEGLEVKGDFLSCINQLEEAMNILIKIYDHIQNYQEQQNLANYIADINSAAANDISITNPVLITAVEKLGFITKSNIVLQQYKTAMDAFKQFVFPFAHNYLEEMDIPSHLKPGNDTDSLISKVSDQIKDLKLKLRKYARSNKFEDKYIGRGPFNSQHISTDPFFVWRNEEHNDLIYNLLSGREVLVKADIATSDIHNKDAIKFNVIDLNLKSQNKSLQYQISYLAQGFEVQAIHMGDSYYRYDNKVYLIETNSQTIEFYIEKNPDGTPLHTGGVYDNIKEGDFMLSPYASWKITLFRLTNRISFEDLLKYKDEIDLELAGEGHYVKNRAVVGLDLHMEKYYKTAYAYDLIDHNTRELKPENATFSEESNSTDWFSWTTLPSFSILPGADAADIENDFVNRKEYKYLYHIYAVEKILEQEYSIGEQREVVLENNTESILSDKFADKYEAEVPGTLLDYVTAPFINCVRLFKNAVSSKLSARSIKTNSPKNVIVNYANAISEDTPNPVTSLMAISSNGEKNNKVVGFTTGSMDVIGNLTLAQLLVQKVFGANESLRNTNYLSPAIEHAVKVNQLAAEVLQVLKGDFLYADGDWDDEHGHQPQWFHDLYLNYEFVGTNK